MIGAMKKKIQTRNGYERTFRVKWALANRAVAVKHLKGAVHKFKSGQPQVMPVRFKWKPADV